MLRRRFMSVLGNMDLWQKGAFLRHPEWGLLIGEGPFTEYETCPKGQPAFYVNTFRLDDPKPWKVPAHMHRHCSDEFPYSKVTPVIAWESPLPDVYAQVFAEILESIVDGRLVKTVPALPQFGTLEMSQSPLVLLSRVLNAPKTHYPFAWWNGRVGFCGATPELLFRREGKLLQTMALAGTARPEDESVFVSDDKEIREHEIVAGSILSRLAPFGRVKRSPRSVIHLGSLIHFLTHLELEADVNVTSEEVIELLHPTPALGPKPRNPETLAMLDEWRRRLRCPAYFGAPFGVSFRDTFFCVVGIRAISWEENRLALCSGGGVVSSSSLTSEWRELALKRKAIRKSFRLA